jgi:hypothetical protein
MMEVRLKIGRYDGEIKDLAPEVAKQMIADDRAEDPRLAPGPDNDCAPAYEPQPRRADAAPTTRTPMPAPRLSPPPNPRPNPRRRRG